MYKILNKKKIAVDEIFVEIFYYQYINKKTI